MSAAHLEVTHSFDTDSFIMALRRFPSHQGNPVRVLSDNGTNIVGAERQLRESIAELDQVRIRGQLSAHGVQWSFNPPAAP